MDPSHIYSKLPDPVRQQIEITNQRRFDQLNGLIISNAEGAWQFLLAVNGGSAVAVLAFIGAVQGLRREVWVYAILFIFAIGLVLVGVGRVMVLRNMEFLLEQWNRNVSRMHCDEMTWDEVVKADLAAHKNIDRPAYIVGYASALMFCIGLAMLCFCFFRYVLPTTV